MTTEQKLPEWWDTFVEAVRTRTLDKYECRFFAWPDPSEWGGVVGYIQNIYNDASAWQFRKRARTVRIEIDDELVELVAPVLAGDVVPRDTRVWTIYGSTRAYDLLASSVVFTSESDRDAMRAALLGVKP